MKVSFFIDRPVFSAVISIVIVIVGIIGLTMLPVDQYPTDNTARCENQCILSGGKCADCVTSSGDSYRTGNKRYSGYVVHGVQQFQFRWLSATVTFDVSADPDLAAVEIQNRISWRKAVCLRKSSEWYFGRKAGSQPADDNLFDFQ